MLSRLLHHLAPALLQSQFPLTLGELGIPANDIVKIYTEDKVNYVHLAGDDSGDLD